MYETMVFWETASIGADSTVVIRDFAEIWRAAEKISLLRDASDRVERKDADRT